MLTLINRELRSISVYLVFPAFVTLLIILGLVRNMLFTPENLSPLGVPLGIPGAMYSAFKFPLILWPFICAGIGAAQMYFDRSKKISAWLCTLATSRNRILTARIIAGSTSFLLILVPLALTDALWLSLYPRLVPIDAWPLIQLFITVTLLNAACYALGLLMGFNTNRFFPILGSVFLSAPIIALIIVKGFGFETMFLLLLLAAALILRTWQKFSTASL